MQLLAGRGKADRTSALPETNRIRKEGKWHPLVSLEDCFVHWHDRVAGGEGDHGGTRQAGDCFVRGRIQDGI